uniref:Zinc finger PMZ-type domain-containing protein n=1 Tax=Lactuca sativa TaxID=4236 RepID=A0A9R1UMP1_LACSA|nr:hypothetical protein LSAT_V11C800424920 [Lactuca sativa]
MLVLDNVGMQKDLHCVKEGDLKDHYSKLWDYGAEIKRANPGSHVEVYVQPQNNSTVVFERFYVSFKGVVDGWLDGCRKCYIKRFWRAVKATTIPKFELAMKEIKSFDVGAYDYLIKRDPNCWSRDFFKVGIGCDAMENGVSESFNVAIEEARKKPLITMLEDIRKRECGCRGWQLTGIPRVHAICAISSLNLDPEEFVADWFTKYAFLRAYEYTIHPLKDSNLWP